MPSDGKPPTSTLHRVAVLADETVAPFELAAAVHLFQSAVTPPGTVRYEVGVVGRAHPAAVPSSAPSLTVVPAHPLSWAGTADTLVVPGHAAFADVVPGEVAALVGAAGQRGARLVALGAGAFALAAAGVLDGRAATTHHGWADRLAGRHPRVRVRREALFVADGPVHTAAGEAAAVDLVLALIEHDHGAAAAAATADAVVAGPRRDGGRPQYAHHVPPVERDPVQEAMRWAEEHLAEPLGVAELARHAHMSPRHFGRRFRAVAGATPLDWLLRVRLRRAQELLERTSWSVERVAHESGFGSPGTFRHHFARVVGSTPGGHRRTHTHLPAGRCA